MPKNTLTPKQDLFVHEYMIDLNATQAAIRAGYSKKTAYSIGNENLSKPEIKSAIDAKKAEKARKIDITVDSVLNDIIRIGDKAEQSDRYNDALKARELLGKHLKMFTDKVETTGDLTINVVQFSNQERLEAPAEPQRIDAKVEELDQTI